MNIKNQSNAMVERLQLAFKESGKSYGDIAIETDIPKSAVHRYIIGETPKIPLDRLEKIATALGVSAKWILGWEQTQQKNSIIADLTIRMRTDEKFASFVEKAASLTPEKLSSLDQVLDVLLKG